MICAEFYKESYNFLIMESWGGIVARWNTDSPLRTLGTSLMAGTVFGESLLSFSSNIGGSTQKWGEVINKWLNYRRTLSPTMSLIGTSIVTIVPLPR